MKAKKDKKPEKANKAKGSWLKKLLLALMILAVLAAAVYIVLDLVSGDETVGEFINGALSSEMVRTEKFVFDAYSDNIFEELGGGLVAVSTSAYQVFDSSGELVGRGTKAFGAPAADSGPAGAVLWSQGGTDMLLAAADGSAIAIDSEEAIISAAINDNGYVAVSTEESGYKGLVTVYNIAGEDIYKWYSGEGYLMDAAVNHSDTGMAALTVSGSGSRLVAYTFGSADVQGAYNEPETIYFDMDYIAENRICAVSENKAVFVNGKCEYNSEYSFDGWYLRNYSLDGNGYAVFVLNKYRSGGETMIVSVGSDGSVKGSVSTFAEVRGISVRGRYIAITCADEMTLYDSELIEVGSIKDTAGVEKALACADGKLIAVSANGAVEYDF